MREQRQSKWILRCHNLLTEDKIEKLEVKVGMLQGSVLSPFLFALVVDVVAEFTRNGVLRELLYANDIVLMSEIMEALRDKFLKWKDCFESKGLKVNLGKTKVMVSSITQDGLSERKVDPCGSAA